MGQQVVLLLPTFLPDLPLHLFEYPDDQWGPRVEAVSGVLRVDVQREDVGPPDVEEDPLLFLREEVRGHPVDGVARVSQGRPHLPEVTRRTQGDVVRRPDVGQVYLESLVLLL